MLALIGEEKYIYTSGENFTKDTEVTGQALKIRDQGEIILVKAFTTVTSGDTSLKYLLATEMATGFQISWSHGRPMCIKILILGLFQSTREFQIHVASYEHAM